MGTLLIPYAGVQYDEALFGIPIYQNINAFSISVFGHSVPLMVMSYIGTLKTGLYALLFTFVRPSLLSIRLPMVVAGALTIWGLFSLARRMAGDRAAWLSTALLTTDALFLLTNTFDWGPVAIEHLLVVSGAACLARFAQRALALSERAQLPRDVTRDLAVGFFLFGLALWNKAIFLWALSGVSVAASVVYWTHLRRLASRTTLLIAACAFLAGCSPFMVFNLYRPNATLGTNAHLENPDWHTKSLQVSLGLDGATLFGYIVSDDSTHPKPVTSATGRVAQWIRKRSGEHRQGYMYAAFVACLLAAPLWWHSRAARFSLLFLGVAWVQMAITQHAGTSAHHAVLLWPFPHLFIGATLARMRPALIGRAIVAVLVCCNLLVINQYLYQFERYGAGDHFTDALTRLPGVTASLTEDRLYITEWGIASSLAMFPHGTIQLAMLDRPFVSDTPTDEQMRDRDRAFTDPHGVFIEHSEGQESFAGSRRRFADALQAAGLRKNVFDVVCDVNGRPRFQLFRLVPSAPKTPAH